MCGIVGYIGNASFDESLVLNSIKHRGPDGIGAYRYKNIFLGHARLSILDLSDLANQPMLSDNKNYVIIFNGEIYNHLDIRKNFLKEITFKSTGDTETVLNAYIKYGEKCLELFNGIFSFAVLDLSKNEIFIARDHFGVKPLYIYNDGINFIFGSEIKSFLHFDIDKSISIEALCNYITFLWSPGDATPFKFIKKLLPGTYIKFDINNLKSATAKSYNNYKFKGKYLNLPEAELIDQLDILLTKAVKRQLLSDVPIGFFLSGGLDSTLLVAIAKKLYPDSNFPCFTIDVNGWDPGSDGFTDDLKYAKMAAEFLNVDLSIVKADIDIVRDFDKMIWHLDEPQADAAPLNVFNIAKLAKEKNIKVLIGGAAGDDIFSGYRRHIALNYEPIIEKFPLFLRKGIKLFTNAIPYNTPLFRRIKKMCNNFDLCQIDRVIGYFDWMNTDSVKKLFKPEFSNQIDIYDTHHYFKYLLNQTNLEDDLLQKMLYLELKTFLVDHNLNYTDKMSMAVGVEARVPYLDIELVDFVEKIPTKFKLKGNETKYILKKVAERYLPKEIIYRPKTGFGAPVRKWVTDDLSDLINTRLSRENIIKQGVFNFEEIEKLIYNNKNGKIDASYNIWAILAINSWINQFDPKIK